MTLNQIKVNLFSHFKENNQFIYPDDRLKVVPISETPELHYAAIIEALKDFEAAKLVSRIEYIEGKKVKENKIGYILEKPAELFTQNLQIPGDLALEISTLVNSLNVDLPDMKKFSSSPLGITLNDIEILILLARAYVNQAKGGEIQGKEESNDFLS